MDGSRFTFEFEEISDKLNQSKLLIFDHHKERRFETQVSINDRVILRERGLQVKPYIADLMDLAVSIYVADRWARRKPVIRVKSKYACLFGPRELGMIQMYLIVCGGCFIGLPEICGRLGFPVVAVLVA